MIDLRSDTATRPTAEMRVAIAAAVVGDEQKREDPTVNELERRGALLVGQEEAVFLPTATMANQIALRILGEPGDEVLAEENSHILLSELGGPAVHSGLVTRGLPGQAGRFSPEQIRAAYRDRTSMHVSPTRLVVVENTHNSSGGRAWPLEEIHGVVETCRELDIRVHLDGARLMNAALAIGVAAAEIGRLFDTVTLCLSKALGCPLGALLAGPAELMAKARRGKHLFGGAMRQAGIVAAAGVYALDHHVDRLADDHARARRLAEGLHGAGVPVELDQVETNFVQVDFGPLGLTREDALARLREHGVLLSTTVHPTVLRAVTHLDVSDDDVERALDAIPRALGALARV
ncbi:MAG: threonine aldolase family protein [Gaiellaceae bacterium]